MWNIIKLEWNSKQAISIKFINKNIILLTFALSVLLTVAEIIPTNF